MIGKYIKKFILLLGVLIVCFVCINFYKSIVYAGNSNRYLVLVQQKDGKWKSYKNMIETSGSGDLMIKAKSISKALGFSYRSKSNGTFVIKRSTARYNTYTRNSYEFIYTNGTLHSNKSASYKAYTSQTSNYNLCQISSLSTLAKFKYFDTSKDKEYPSYRGVVCYSKYNLVPSSVPASKPEPTKKPTPKPIPEPSSITIEGVEFPVRDRFLSVKAAGNDWGGLRSTWDQLEEAVDGKILASTDLSIGLNSIGFSHLLIGSDGVYLTKASKGYKLSINVKLKGSVLSDQNAAIVKAMVVTISSKPTIVYTALFESFTTDHTHGINEDHYVKIGDCNIKVEIKGGKVIYYIKG